MRLALLVVAIVVAVCTHAVADPARPVALLPLDAEQRLEIYGQPVASEIARALGAGSVEVVVVGRKMAVPERARLIVDGTIAAKGDSIVITLRVRDRADGQVLDTLTSTAASLASIDTAASDLSTRLLPSVKQRLAALDPRPEVRPADCLKGPNCSGPISALPIVTPPPAKPVKPPALLVALSPRVASASEPLRLALAEELERWTRAHHREPRSVTLDELARARAVKTVAAAGTSLGIAFEIGNLAITPGPVPLARARVRVRIADATRVLFDRVILTDTIVGDKGMSHDQLAQRVAGELLLILRPHLRRLVGGWS